MIYFFVKQNKIWNDWLMTWCGQLLGRISKQLMRNCTFLVRLGFGDMASPFDLVNNQSKEIYFSSLRKSFTRRETAERAAEFVGRARWPWLKILLKLTAQVRFGAKLIMV